MPTVTVPSVSCFTHSCDFVYLRLAGVVIDSLREMLRPQLPGRFYPETMIVPCCRLLSQHLAVAHERRLDDTGAQHFVADGHFRLVSRTHRNGHAGQRDRAIERRAESAAGDFAVAVRGAHLLMTAHHAFVDQQKPECVA